MLGNCFEFCSIPLAMCLFSTGAENHAWTNKLQNLSTKMDYSSSKLLTPFCVFNFKLFSYFSSLPSNCSEMFWQLTFLAFFWSFLRLLILCLVFFAFIFFQLNLISFSAEPSSNFLVGLQYFQLCSTQLSSFFMCKSTKKSLNSKQIPLWSNNFILKQLMNFP